MDHGKKMIAWYSFVNKLIEESIILFLQTKFSSKSIISLIGRIFPQSDLGEIMCFDFFSKTVILSHGWQKSLFNVYISM